MQSKGEEARGDGLPQTGRRLVVDSEHWERLVMALKGKADAVPELVELFKNADL